MSNIDPGEDYNTFNEIRYQIAYLTGVFVGGVLGIPPSR